MSESVFCKLLENPDIEPWFTANVERWADLFDLRPKPIDVSIRAKWILQDAGLAATGLQVLQGKKPLPTPQEHAGAWILARRQLWQETFGPNAVLGE